MARRRYLSTEISTDRVVNRLAREHGDFAALLYTWMIPHAEDDATLPGDPEELMLTVIPGRRDRDVADVEAALAAMDELGLIRWDREAGTIRFPARSFYRYQTYIPRAKRFCGDDSANHRAAPTNSEDQRETPQTAASPSPSPSPSTPDDDDSAPGPGEREPAETDPDKASCLDLINRRRPDWVLSGERYRAFLGYEEKLPWSVIRLAVDRTLAAGARDLNYCLRILEHYVEQRVRSPADVAALDAEFEAEKRRLSRASHGRGGGRQPASSNVILKREKKDDSYYDGIFKSYDTG